MKKLLCVMLWVLPAMLFAQSPFDGTWKTNMAESKLSPKPYVFSVDKGMYDCESCVPKINIKADGQDQAVTGQTYDTLAVQVVDADTIHATGKKAGKPTFEQTRTVSSDGKTLTVSTTGYPAVVCRAGCRISSGSFPFAINLAQAIHNNRQQDQRAEE